MQGHRVMLPFHVPGTLTADLVITWVAPFDGRVKHIGAVGSNANNGLLIFGISTDTNSILASASIGDSGTPIAFTVADFASTNPTGAFSKGEILVATLDFDGAAGTATDDFTLVVTLLDG